MREAPGDPFAAADFVRALSHAPGVYRMLDADGGILYVGKARDLKKRVGSYFTRAEKGERTRRMLAQTRGMEVTVTATEADALLLENTLIKEHRPRYNVLLRDDKSYPYLYVSAHQEYPALSFYRGRRRRRGRTFGPYAGVGALRETLGTLQKLFRVRQCSDSMFRNRVRPCLQYQIKRCTAPCVGYISPADYRADVALTVQFLEGRNDAVVRTLNERMDRAAQALDYERAGEWRDRIQALQAVRRNYRTGVAPGRFDALAAVCEQGACCVQVASFRGGASLGARSHFPRLDGPAPEPAELLRGFLGQYYLEREAPPELLLSHAIRDPEAVAAWLGERAGRRVRLRCAPRGRRRAQVELAAANARQAIRSRAQSRAGMAARLEELGRALRLDAPPARLECFDVSHTRGEAAVASCVVWTAAGPDKSAYRRFNLAGLTPGDDCAGLRQALARRYARVRAGEYPPPDVLFVDGGRGQVCAARAALDGLELPALALVGVAKGPGRTPGRETLYASTLEEPLRLPAASPALHLVQQLRDEAHRFAITGHRRLRAKRRTDSPLEEVPGVGARRRAALLRHFGGWQGVRDATEGELAAAPGVGPALARAIHRHLRAA